ncbi:MAG: transaldolase [Alphaproteobacteria bacterium]
MQSSPPELRIRIFADGADLAGIADLARDPRIAGFTTNPTLMRQAGVRDYARFARDVLALVPDRPVSFEVIADDLDGIERQALTIAGWGANAWVKVPVTTTAGTPCAPVVRRLALRGVRVNVTAILTLAQVRALTEAMPEDAPAIFSVFAGRIADTGRDPVPLMRAALAVMAARPRTELLWASPREVLNVYQADAAGCHIITCTADLLRKLALRGRDLAAYSLETVAMFRRDALAAGYAVPADAAFAVAHATAAE